MKTFEWVWMGIALGVLVLGVGTMTMQADAPASFCEASAGADDDPLCEPVVGSKSAQVRESEWRAIEEKVDLLLESEGVDPATVGEEAS